MKLLLFMAACVLLMMLLLWVLGPRVTVKKAPTSKAMIPEDVEEYLRERESKTSQPIKNGLEAEVIWADPDHQKTKYSIVYLHGFSSSRGEMSPVFERVADSLGTNIFFTRFKGHGGESGEMLNEVSPEDWMLDAIEARTIGEKIGEKVIIAGTSHGALLASWVSTLEGFSDSPEAVILISPNFAPYDNRTRLLTKPWARQILPLLFGSHRDWDPQNSGHEYYWNTVYPSHALFPMMAQVDFITPSLHEKTQPPLLVLYSKKDLTVKADKIETVFAQIPSESKKLIEIHHIADKQQHILAGDILSAGTTEDVISEIQDFLNEVGVSAE